VAQRFDRIEPRAAQRRDERGAPGDHERGQRTGQRVVETHRRRSELRDGQVPHRRLRLRMRELDQALREEQPEPDAEDGQQRGLQAEVQHDLALQHTERAQHAGLAASLGHRDRDRVVDDEDAHEQRDQAAQLEPVVQRLGQRAQPLAALAG
jgi:hypothetical protein